VLCKLGERIRTTVRVRVRPVRVAATSASILLQLFLGGATPTGAGYQPRTTEQSQASSSVTEISLERRCFLCDRRYRVVLKHDGTAMRIKYAFPLSGDADREFVGTVTKEAFAQLARLIEDKDFFHLEERYPPPDEDRGEDGAWCTTTVSNPHSTKAVLNRNAAGPPELELIEDAVDEVASHIAWSAKQP
jgi:hypothetical protein